MDEFSPLFPIAAAAELIAGGPGDRLHGCGNCPWLFLDLSRNGRRRHPQRLAPSAGADPEPHHPPAAKKGKEEHT